MNDTKTSATATAERATDAASLTVLHLSDDLRTSIAIEPTELETYPDVRKHVVDDRAAIAESLARLGATPLLPYDGAIDVRWGLIYADAGGTTIASVYIDRFGICGYVDARPAGFDDRGAFLDYVRATYPD